MRYSIMTHVMKQNEWAARGVAGAMLVISFTVMAGCGGSENPAPVSTPGGSTGLTTPLAFVNNRDDKTLAVVTVDGANSKIITTLPASAFESNAIGDMVTSEGEWVFVNLGVGNKVATIDPISGAAPLHETNLPTGERPVHIYVDPTDKEVVWSMNDADATTGLDSINCATVRGGSVTILHNSHLGPGGDPPKVEKTLCLLGAGHKVAAFSQPTATDATIPKRAFISSEITGEIAVIDNEPASGTFRTIIRRIDLCTNAGETLNGKGACDVNADQPNVVNTPNSSAPHGIRWSQTTGKVYSIQEDYKTIVEIDPASYATTRTLDLAGTPYTAFGITPNGRFLFLRGINLTADPAHVIGKLAVVDLTATNLALTEVASLQDVSPSTFKFSPDGKRLFLIAANTATGASAGQSVALKKDRLLVFDPSVLPSVIAPLAEITLPAATGHSFDVVVKGAGVATDVVVSNGTTAAPGSISILNVSTNSIGNAISVGTNPGSVMAYVNGAVSNGNIATAEVASNRGTPQPERLDDHGMPE